MHRCAATVHSLLINCFAHADVHTEGCRLVASRGQSRPPPDATLPKESREAMFESLTSTRQLGDLQ
jgi:hypothetical protein